MSASTALASQYPTPSPISEPLGTAWTGSSAGRTRAEISPSRCPDGPSATFVYQRLSGAITMGVVLLVRCRPRPGPGCSLENRWRALGARRSRLFRLEFGHRVNNPAPGAIAMAAGEAGNVGLGFVRGQGAAGVHTHRPPHALDAKSGQPQSDSPRLPAPCYLVTGVEGGPIPSGGCHNLGGGVRTVVPNGVVQMPDPSGSR